MLIEYESCHCIPLVNAWLSKGVSRLWFLQTHIFLASKIVQVELFWSMQIFTF